MDSAFSLLYSSRVSLSFLYSSSRAFTSSECSPRRPAALSMAVLSAIAVVMVTAATATQPLSDIDIASTPPTAVFAASPMPLMADIISLELSMTLFILSAPRESSRAAKIPNRVSLLSIINSTVPTTSSENSLSPPLSIQFLAFSSPSSSRGFISSMVSTRASFISSTLSLRTVSPSCAKSSRGCAISTRAFPQEALSLLREPSMVVSASFAVVPVIPRFVCITWIASITLSKGISLTFFAVATI